MKKKLRAVSLALGVVMLMSSCGGGAEANAPTTSSEAAPPAASSEAAAETPSEAASESTAPSEEPASEGETSGFNPDAFQVKAIDDKTLEVKLTAITPYFLELTAFPTFNPVPLHIIDEVGEAWATDAATYIGNGPYKVTAWTPSDKIVAEKNTTYWNAANLGPDTISFALMEDDAAQLTAYESGQLQFIDAIPQDELDRVSSQPDFHKEGQLGTYYVSYNVTAAPFDNPLVRQAFTLAVDRDYIVTQIGKAGQIPAGAYVPVGLTDADASQEFRDVGGDYYDPTSAGNEANLAKAKEVLAEAGYPNGEGLPTVTYVYNEGTGHQAIGEALQQMWSELGATVTLESQEWATFLNTRKNGEYQVARNGWLGDYNDPISFLDMWITDGGNNDAQWSNTEYDGLISEIKNSGDQARRMELMHQAENIIFDEWMLCPIYYYVDVYMQNNALDGSVWASPLGYKYLMYANQPELNVCIGPNPDTIDPALNSAVDGATLIIHNFEGLYTLDDNGVPIPGQAESVDVSDDGLTYTFHLRDGIQFSDGTPITAQTFVDSWVRAINPETAADYAYMFESIAGYTEALGE
ncbi:MAG: ABC transporter substrate-binding protein [Clostridiales bacterium]|jgi:oligopeptide transport system substrate-binding protein|nr:ABC transporter substrate-binding protein [Clostridiales bacterium]